jgi:peptidoglycan/xylan/chitin deacetylase (PgdA/CDA1 family)
MPFVRPLLEDGFHLRPYLLRRGQERELAGLCRRTRSLVLSYDDGPGPRLTERLLDLLAQRGQRAVFFLLGRAAPAGAEVVDRMLREGHEVGCHGQDHLNAWHSAPAEAVRDVESGYRALSRWIAPNALFRPPYGKPTGAVLRDLKGRGARIGWWTVDSGDTHEKLPRSPRPVLEAVRRGGGGVVLMHDFDRQGERADFVLETTSQLLDLARAEGLTVRRFCDLWGNGDGLLSDSTL